MRAVAFLFLAGCAGSLGHARLDGGGAEAWAFEVPVAGTVEGACDEVTVESPRASVAATVEGDRFAAVVPLAAGVNDVVAVCRAGDERRRSAPQRWQVRAPDRPRALARIRWGKEGLVLDGGGSRRGPVRPAPVVTWEWSAREGSPAPLPSLPATGAEVALAAPTVDGDYLVDLRVVDADGVEDRAAVRFRVAGGEVELPDPIREHPAWVDDAVVYGIAPFFFGDGTLADVIPRLPELAALGVTVLWLSPVMVTAPGDFGYATIDHFRVRDDFGGDAELAQLIEAAHARGMRVILDFIANHTGIEHPYVEARPELYDRDAAGELTHYFDWEHLPNLEVAHPEVVTWMTEAFAHWVAMGVDGFRADVAWGPGERDPDFWPAVRAELARIEPDLLWLAEATARNPFWFHRGFDVAYDWTWELGDWAWRGAFDEVDAGRLAAALTADGDGYDPDALVFRFLDNNDTGARFVTRYGPERVPASAAVLFTVPGIPSLWTGSEVGAAFEPYDEGPPIEWTDRYGLVPVYTRLANLRHGLPALRGRALELVETSDPSVIAFVRPAVDDGDAVLVVADLTGEGGAVSLVDEPALAAVVDASMRDLFHEVDVPVTTAAGRVELTLPDDGVRILVAD